MNNKSLVADKLENTSATLSNNYWSPLACLVKEKEEKYDILLHVDHLLSITTDMSKPTVTNKTSEKWKQKIANRSGILDTGCTLGAGAEMDMECFHDTGLTSKKVFMLPDTSKIPTTKIMRLKHNLYAGAGEINIVPDLHSTLISVPKMAEHGYIAVFDKKEAKFYDGTTTTLMASGEPIIIAPRCENTGLWKMNLDLDYKIPGRESSDQFIVSVDAANTIFDLPNSQQLLMYFHAAVGFPTIETFAGSPSRQLRNVVGSHNNPHL